MKPFKNLLWAALLPLAGCLNQPQSETAARDPAKVRVAFYNVENLFDTEDDPYRRDEEFLPSSEKQWTKKRYADKINKLAQVIAELQYPVLLGLAEVENEAVIRRLATHEDLAQAGYEVVHYESPDGRGIDVALLYRTAFFTPVSSQAVPVSFAEDDYKSRDILLVSGTLGQDAQYNTLHVLVNHWPSRRGGVQQSEPRRMVAAQAARQTVDQLIKGDPSANVLLMGDFNDEPPNRSITEGLKASASLQKKDPFQLFNATAALDELGRGTYNFRGNWNMLDQIILSSGLVEDARRVDDYHYEETSATIFSPEWLLQAEGKYQGHPDRTYAGNRYLGGYSDHLPVYVVLTKE